MRAALLLACCVAGCVLAPATVHALPPAGAAVASTAPRCAASIEEAARGILGASGTSASAGYRVQDLVVDPVLRKAWVRVADCHDAGKPLTLVPLSASLATGSTVPSRTLGPHALEPQTLEPQAVGTLATPPQRLANGTGALREVPAANAAPVLIARGDAVEVLVASSNVHMMLQGHAAVSASAGEAVDVVLDTAPSTDGTQSPARHLRGIAAAAHRVEVQQ